MSLSLSAGPSRLNAVANAALPVAAGFWFVIAVIGQLIFAVSTALFYGRATARGDFLAWNRNMTHGYVAGHGADNVACAVHVAMAVLIILSGALQLTPQVRNAAPRFHRWNGRVYMVAAYTISLAGLWMVWIRGTPGDTSEHLALTLNAVLIMLFAAMALRHALARDFRTHRRWALRLFVVVGGVWFQRLAVPLTFLTFGRIPGLNVRTLDGPYMMVMVPASFLVPLAILEIYLRARDFAGLPGRVAMAACVAVCTLLTAAGVAGAAALIWAPEVTPAFASHASVTEALSTTISTSGVDDAVVQFRSLKAAGHPDYTLGENDLNFLGYELIHAGRVGDATRIFEENVSAFPQSANVYDSLGEAYMDAGNSTLAITNYRKSLALNPGNQNAAEALQELGAR